MPAAVYHNDTALSFAYAINKAQDTFTINKDAEGNRTDGFLKDSAKVVTRVPVNMTLAVLATIETVVKALLTAISAILYPITDVPYNYFKDSTALAGRATKEALKGILGYASPEPVITVTKEIIEADVVVKRPPPPSIPTPTLPTPEPTRSQKVQNFFSNYIGQPVQNLVNWHLEVSG